MGLRTASVRRRADVSLDMAPALTETKNPNNFKLTSKTNNTTVVSPLNHIEAKKLTEHNNHNNNSTNNEFDITPFELAAEILKGELSRDHLHLASDKQQQQQTLCDIMTESPMDEHSAAKMGLKTTNVNQALLKDKVNSESDVDQIFNSFTSADIGHNVEEIMQVIKSFEGEECADRLSSVPDLVGESDGMFPGDLTGNLTSLEKALFNDVEMMSISMEEQLIESSGSATSVVCKDNQTKELIADVQVKQARMERKLDFLLRRLRKIQSRYMGQHISEEVAGVYEHVHRTLRRLKDTPATTDPIPETPTSLIDNPSYTDNPPLTPFPATPLNPFPATSLTPFPATLSLNPFPATPSNPFPATLPLTPFPATLPLNPFPATPLNPTTSDSAPLKPITHSATKNLVKKLENSTLLQATSAARQRQSARYFGSGSIEPSSFRSGGGGMTTLPTWPVGEKAELQRVVGQLYTQMGVVQEEVDSEATVSSSGGESCDELQTYNNPHQQYLSIQKRATWKYGTSRATIAARWSWLLAQISDLEYRIRQHNDLYRQIRGSKSAVRLGGASPPHVTSTTVPAAAVNGYRGPLPGGGGGGGGGFDSSGGVCDSADTDPTLVSPALTQCARTRPLLTTTSTTSSGNPNPAFSKRKLLQTGGLHAISKKAARPSNVRCGCAPPLQPCALCTGRTDPTHPRDPVEYLSRPERIALLDAGYHPVFSLPEDTSISIHMEAIMKSNEWQSRSSRSSLKAMKYALKADRLSEKQAIAEQRPKKSLEHRKKYSRLIKSTAVTALSAKLKNKYRTRGKAGRHPTTSLTRKQQRAAVKASRLLNSSSYSRQSPTAGGGDLLDDDYDEDYGDYCRYDSPSTSPLLTAQSVSGFGRNNRNNRIDSYDIDNIVIPYSVAASTRVEKLQYKEILTPKWRMIETDTTTQPKYDSKNNGAVKYTSQDSENSDIEDISEESVLARHDKSEQDEKRKFLSYLKLPLGYRGRAQQVRRTDSRAESSGANTPDPMSPVSVAATLATVTSTVATSSANTTLSTTTSASSSMVTSSNITASNVTAVGSMNVTIGSSKATVSGSNATVGVSSNVTAVGSGTNVTMDASNVTVGSGGTVTSNNSDVVTEDGEKSVDSGIKEETSGSASTMTPIDSHLQAVVSSATSLSATTTQGIDESFTSQQLGGPTTPDALRNLPLSSLNSLRRRTISQSSRSFAKEPPADSSDASLEQQLPPPVMPPYDRRQFPLAEETYDRMIRTMPDNHRNHPTSITDHNDSTATSRPYTDRQLIQQHRDSTTTTTTTSYKPSNSYNSYSSYTARLEAQQRTRTRNESRGDDYDSESTESAFEDDDPNDPEWDEEYGSAAGLGLGGGLGGGFGSRGGGLGLGLGLGGHQGGVGRGGGSGGGNVVRFRR